MKYYLNSKSDLFSRETISNDMCGFEWGFFFSGNFEGVRYKSFLILYVTCWVKDGNDHIFVRSASYRGPAKFWREPIIYHIKQLMCDLGIPNNIVRAETRYLDGIKEKFIKPEIYNERLEKLLDKIKGANP